MTNVDDVVQMAIEDLYPDRTIPDENNLRQDGTRYKAPDFSILAGKVLIELKSRNIVDNGQFYEKVRQISEQQGSPVRGYGKGDLGRLIERLPDPTAANAKLIDAVYRQSGKSAHEARRKFESYAENHPDQEAIRLLIISDNTDIAGTNNTEEAYFGRKMGAYDSTHDDLGMIDAIVLIKDPRLVFDRVNSYWFKCLVRTRVNDHDFMTLMGVVESLRLRIASYADYVDAIANIRVGEYRVLRV